MSLLANKVAIITGSGKGLGRAFAEYLLKRGSKVVLSDVDPKLGQITHDELKNQYGQQVFFQKCDVTSPKDMESLFGQTKSSFGNIHLVCNNAGIIHERHWQKMLDVNLAGAIHGTQLGVEYMSTENGGEGGVIINVSSAAGLEIVPFSPSYCASKHGLVAYSRSLAAHHMTTKGGIRLNCLCPTFTDTDIIKITKEQVYGLGMAIGTMQELKLMTVQTVVDAFAKLVENETYHGQVLRITPQGERFK